MSQLIEGSQISTLRNFMLEDIELGLCGILQYIWAYSQIRQLGELSSQILLTRQLDTWKLRLDQISRILNDSATDSNTTDQLLGNYLGEEEPNKLGWQTTVKERVVSLFIDTKMLYHLLSLHLYADIRTIKAVAASKTIVGVQGIPKLVADFGNKPILQDWAVSGQGRQAFMHAISVLQCYEEGMPASTTQGGGLSTVSTMTGGLSALVVQAWILNSMQSCTCDGTTHYYDFSQSFADTRENPDLLNWIENGGPVALEEISFCHCKVDFWTSRFATLLG